MKHEHRQNVSIGYDHQSPEDSLTTTTDGSNQTLYNSLWNVLPLMLQCRKKMRKCLGVVDSPGAHADSVHPIEVLLRLIPTNGQDVIMPGRCAAAETLH